MVSSLFCGETYTSIYSMRAKFGMVLPSLSSGSPRVQVEGSSICASEKDTKTANQIRNKMSEIELSKLLSYQGNLDSLNYGYTQKRKVYRSIFVEAFQPLFPFLNESCIINRGGQFILF